MNMNRIITILAQTAVMSFMAVSCQTEDVAGLEYDGTTSIVSFCPTVSGQQKGLTKGSYSEDEIISGEIVTISSKEDPSTKGELVNRDGEGAIPYPTDKTFFVTAWDSDGTSESIGWSEVRYFDTVLDDGSVHRNMWNTIGDDGKMKIFFSSLVYYFLKRLAWHCYISVRSLNIYCSFSLFSKL